MSIAVGDVVEGGAVDQRSDERAVGQRVADRHRHVGLGQPFDQLVVDGFVDDEAPQAGAALPGRADGREGDAPNGKIEIGSGSDDRRVVATQLEDQSPEATGDDRGHGTTHSCRSGRRDDGDVWMGGEGGADVGIALQHLVEATWGTDVVGCLVEHSSAGQGSQRRLVGRLPQHRIARDKGQRSVPRPHRHGEVERRDDGARTHRVPGFHQPVAWPFAGDRQAVQLTRQADGEVADVDHLLHLAEAFRADLAGLDRHQLTELRLELAEQFAQAADQRTTHRWGSRSPLGEGFDGGRHGGIDVGRRTRRAE